MEVSKKISAYLRNNPHYQHLFDVIAQKKTQITDPDNFIGIVRKHRLVPYVFNQLRHNSCALTEFQLQQLGKQAEQTVTKNIQVSAEILKIVSELEKNNI
jgi:GTP-sensing pleiotropic transcriptional regulator CodY